VRAENQRCHWYAGSQSFFRAAEDDGDFVRACVFQAPGDYGAEPQHDGKEKRTAREGDYDQTEAVLLPQARCAELQNAA